jgi:hypothetical protein
MPKPKRGAAKVTASVISAGKDPKAQSRILSFSFRHLQTQHAKFGFDHCESGYFLIFLQRIRELSSWTQERFVTELSKSWRIHRIDWQDARVSENTFGTGPNGTATEEHDAHAWQFQLSANEHGRVHGFLVADTFYLVWLDPDHQLYP